jgi:hypothetical protein
VAGAASFGFQKYFGVRCGYGISGYSRNSDKKHKRYLNECGDRSPLDLRENAAKWF